MIAIAVILFLVSAGSIYNFVDATTRAANVADAGLFGQGFGVVLNFAASAHFEVSVVSLVTGIAVLIVRKRLVRIEAAK